MNSYRLCVNLNFLSSRLLQLLSSAGYPEPAGHPHQPEAAEHSHAAKEML